MRTIEQSDEASVPERSDQVIAARTASLMVFAAALWFFVSPWAYYGGAGTTSGWNAWFVGAIMLLLALARTVRPIHTIGFSRANAILAVWVFISPWVFGYAGYTGRLVNSVSVGLFIFIMSLASAKTRSAETSGSL